MFSIAWLYRDVICWMSICSLKYALQKSTYVAALAISSIQSGRSKYIRKIKEDLTHDKILSLSDKKPIRNNSASFDRQNIHKNMKKQQKHKVLKYMAPLKLGFLRLSVVTSSSQNYFPYCICISTRYSTSIRKWSTSRAEADFRRMGWKQCNGDFSEKNTNTSYHFFSLHLCLKCTSSKTASEKCHWPFLVSGLSVGPRSTVSWSTAYFDNFRTVPMLEWLHDSSSTTTLPRNCIHFFPPLQRR